MHPTTAMAHCAAQAHIFAPARLNEYGTVRSHPLTHSHRRLPAPHASAVEAEPSTSTRPLDGNQRLREGSYEGPLVRLQASKADPEQPSMASVLPAVDTSVTYDVAVVGCGPAGLALAAELAKQGLSVALIGPDGPFVNNYGVWVDEFAQLGLEHALDRVWQDAICYFKEGGEVRIGRAYGRVCRRRLRAHLLEQCAARGVQYLAAEVHAIDTSASSSSGSGASAADAPAVLQASGGASVGCRLVTLASGAAAGRFLRYETDAPSVAAQTAYGIEAQVESYDGVYDPSAMLFMDYRRHHSGLYPGTAPRQHAGQHPNGAAGLWGTERETPSFLYAMPLGGGRVFLEETCLVAKPALPFAVLKRRLERRCEALGIKIKEVHEEEWSYIPTGGPLPQPDQPLTAFGAAANLIHPATGYSIARSLREAPAMARAVAQGLEEQPTSAAAARFVWEALWTQEKRRQAAFHVFGMELLCALDVAATSDFFTTFFALPATYWRGFLGSQLSSTDLLGFAMLTFVLAPPGIKAKLVGHLIADPAGRYLVRVYLGQNKQEMGGAGTAGSLAQGSAVAAALAALTALQDQFPDA